MKRIWGMFLAAIACVILGSASGIVVSEAIPTWYVSLNKPDFAPPDWVFGPVWTTLYALIGISFYMVWERGVKKPAVRTALQIFVVQLCFNLVWTWIFFGLRWPELAFVEIVMLCGLIVLNIMYFYKVHKTAALLLVPYLLWVSFASVLNLAIVALN